MLLLIIISLYLAIFDCKYYYQGYQQIWPSTQYKLLWYDQYQMCIKQNNQTYTLLTKQQKTNVLPIAKNQTQQFNSRFFISILKLDKNSTKAICVFNQRNPKISCQIKLNQNNLKINLSKQMITINQITFILINIQTEIKFMIIKNCNYQILDTSLNDTQKNKKIFNLDNSQLVVTSANKIYFFSIQNLLNNLVIYSYFIEIQKQFDYLNGYQLFYQNNLLVLNQKNQKNLIYSRKTQNDQFIYNRTVLFNSYNNQFKPSTLNKTLFIDTDCNKAYLKLDNTLLLQSKQNIGLILDTYNNQTINQKGQIYIGSPFNQSNYYKFKQKLQFIDQYQMSTLKLATLNNQMVFAVDINKNKVFFNRTSKQTTFWKNGEQGPDIIKPFTDYSYTYYISVSIQQNKYLNVSLSGNTIQSNIILPEGFNYQINRVQYYEKEYKQRQYKYLIFIVVINEYNQSHVIQCSIFDISCNKQTFFEGEVTILTTFIDYVTYYRTIVIGVNKTQNGQYCLKSQNNTYIQNLRQKPISIKSYWYNPFPITVIIYPSGRVDIYYSSQSYKYGNYFAEAVSYYIHQKTEKLDHIYFIDFTRILDSREGCYLYYVKYGIGSFQRLNSYQKAPIYYRVSTNSKPICRNFKFSPISTIMKNSSLLYISIAQKVEQKKINIKNQNEFLRNQKQLQQLNKFNQLYINIDNYYQKQFRLQYNNKPIKVLNFRYISQTQSLILFVEYENNKYILNSHIHNIYSGFSWMWSYQYFPNNFLPSSNLQYLQINSNTTVFVHKNNQTNQTQLSNLASNGLRFTIADSYYLKIFQPVNETFSLISIRQNSQDVYYNIFTRKKYFTINQKIQYAIYSKDGRYCVDRNNYYVYRQGKKMGSIYSPQFNYSINGFYNQNTVIASYGQMMKNIVYQPFFNFTINRFTVSYQYYFYEDQSIIKQFSINEFKFQQLKSTQYPYNIVLNYYNNLTSILTVYTYDNNKKLFQIYQTINLKKSDAPVANQPIYSIKKDKIFMQVNSLVYFWVMGQCPQDKPYNIDGLCSDTDPQESGNTPQIIIGVIVGIISLFAIILFLKKKGILSKILNKKQSLLTSNTLDE